MTDLEFGLFAVDTDTRTVRGIIVPWNETSRVNQTRNAPVTFRQGDIRVPRDHTVVSLNRQHDRYDPMGHAARFDAAHERGLYSEWRIADTEEGDAWLADHDGLVRLSPELRDITRHPDGTCTATLTGAALVTEGSFASAGLFAVDAPEEPEAPATPEPIQDPEDTPSPETETESEESTVTSSIVPDGVVTPEAPAIDRSASGLFAALAANGLSGDRSALSEFRAIDSAATGLFALADITEGDRAANAGAGITASTGIGGVIAQSAFLGEIVRGRAYQQRFLPLFNHADLTALKFSGWAWVTPPEVDDWAGNKTEIPSNEVEVEDVEGTAERIAGGHDVDRALRDFGNAAWWASYFRLMDESYAKKADLKVVQKAIAAATTVAPGAVPAGADPGTAAIVDGALAVVDAGYTPTFALVSKAIFRNLLLTPKDKVLEYLTSAMGFEEGQLSGFSIRPYSGLAAKRVVVGTASAATVYELPGAPIRVEGIDVARGGIDPALFGYLGWLTNDAAGLASVTTA